MWALDLISEVGSVLDIQYYNHEPVQGDINAFRERNIDRLRGQWIEFEAQKSAVEEDQSEW